MLTYVPVVFDAYRPLKAHLRWTLQNLVAFADTAGRCFPSVRKLAEVTGLGRARCRCTSWSSRSSGA